MSDLSTTYLGLKLKSPIIASSSGLTNSLQDIKELEANGVGAVVLKSLFEEEIITEMDRQMEAMHSENYLYPETMDYYENYQVEDTLTSYLKLIRDCKNEVKIPVIASINCITAHNWPYFAKSIQDAGADALELNIFASPSDMERSGAENEQLYFDIISAVKKEVSVPITIKINHYFSNLASMVKKLSLSGIKGIVLFNRYYSPDIDVENMDVISTHVFSDSSEYVLPLRWIAITSSHVQCDLAASTGIHDGRTMIKMILAGAKAVQIATTLYKNGMDQTARMLVELERWMKRKNFESIEDFRGKLNQVNAENPAGYLRLQFMKHFSEV
ncbi:dihydroorotate dehydrogenase-like protein [Marinilabiliaceae bacterium JC017]|nr:dihydroorotate dehydrogenase-like protein [Marinilabiliaceae bacterium JC017]